MKKLISLFNEANFNAVKLWVKNGFLLYFSSWKRSFDFTGAPREGEYANFLKVSLGILVTLLVCFWGKEIDVLISFAPGDIMNVVTPGGLVVFWCYGAMALFPFAGIVARRFKQYDIEDGFTVNVFNSLLIVRALLMVEVLEFFVASLFFCVVAPYYVSLVVLSVFCYKLGDMESVKGSLTAIRSEGLVIWKKRFLLLKMFAGAVFIGLLLNLLDDYRFFRGLWVPFYITLFAFLVALGLRLLYHRGADVLFWSILLLNVIWMTKLCVEQVWHTELNLFIVLASVIFVLILVRFLTSKFKKIKIYTALGLWMVLLPLGVWGEVGNLWRNFNAKNQNVEIVRDAQLNALSVPLLKTLVQQGATKNHLVSVHNLYYGLGILANGAEGETLEKLKKLLGSSALEDINVKNKEIIGNHSGALRFDSQVFAAKKHLDKSFVSVLDKYFDANIGSEKKECAIDIYSKLQFSSLWKDKFNRARGTFYTPDGAADVSIFEGKYDVSIAQGNGFRILALSYKSGDIFYIILPDEVEDVTQYSAVLKNIVEKFDVDTFRHLHFERYELEIKIPEFTITRTVSLKDILESLGLGNLFKPYQAELRKVLSAEAEKDNNCDAKRLYIGEFEQENTIKVDKNGTKALSAQGITLNYYTGDIMGGLNRPFIVDRPFIFMINNGAFVGIVYDPRKK